MRVTYVKTPFKSTVSFYNIFDTYGLIFIRFYRQYRHSKPNGYNDHLLLGWDGNQRCIQHKGHGALRLLLRLLRHQGHWLFRPFRLLVAAGLRLLAAAGLRLFAAARLRLSAGLRLLAAGLQLFAAAGLRLRLSYISCPFGNWAWTPSESQY